jgi:hypothetical protein
MYEYAQITVFDIFLSNSLVLGYSASLSSLQNSKRNDAVYESNTHGNISTEGQEMSL